MNNNCNSIFRLEYLVGLILLFIGLKITGYIDWDWIWVLAPLWVTAVLSTVFVGIIIIAALILGLREKNK